MMWRFRFVIITFSLAIVLILTVYLRGTGSHIFYKLCEYNAEQNRLKQRLWQEQLRLENMLNPAELCRRLDESADKDSLNNR